MPRSSKQITKIFLAYGLRLAGQGLSFFLFAKALGANDFGYVIGMLAILGPLSPFVDLGAYSIISRDISLGRNPEKVVAENIKMVFLLMPVGILVALILFYLAYGTENLWIGLFVGIGYLLTSRLSLVMSSIQTTTESRVPFLFLESVSAISMTLLGIYGILRGIRLNEWALLYALSGTVFSLVSLIYLNREFKILEKSNISPRRLKDGLVFSLGSAFQYSYQDMDKIILARTYDPAVVGAYGISSRIASVALIPIGAIYSIFYPRFIQAGEKYKETTSLLKRVLLISSVYSLIISIAVYCLSLFVNDVLGKGYEDSSTYLRYLSIPIVLQVYQIPFADAITGMGRQDIRTAVQGCSVVAAILIGVVLIPLNSIGGVLVSITALHALILLFYLTIYFRLSLNLKRRTQ
ncbi:hypothetical protein BXU09_08375 [Deinococcus sp. LM3]|nr:hypothetical protein BXU09_08375 [Deinococcus sp. LM3]